MATQLLLIAPLAGLLLTALVAAVGGSGGTGRGANRALVLNKGIAFFGFGAITALSILARGEIGSFVAGPTILGYSLRFGLTPLSWYFVIMITGLTFLTVVFSLAALRDGYPMYYGWLFAKSFGMLGVVMAGDLLSFFILWEVMSWATFFLMQQGTVEARRAAVSYLVYALVASMALFAGVFVLFRAAGSFAFTDIAAAIAGFDVGMLLVAVALTIVPMLVEAAVYPAHWWLPPSYAATETSITAYLAGISTRIGIYGTVLFLFTVFGLSTIDTLWVSHYLNLRVVLMVLGAFTMVVPTYTALFQHDAKRLMTWHSIGQGGYMLVGIASVNALGVAGGLFHIFNYLAYVSLLVLTIAAVEYRTGTTNLNKLGGLIKKMPLSFLGLLFGIIGLAGIPPMNGFVSKWLIYRSLILGGHPFIALAAFTATVGTILSVYKLIHNIFLGQLPERYENVREVGPLMQIPIIILMVTVFATGALPGLVLQWVARIQESLGLAPIAWTLTGVAPEMGQLNMGVVTSVFSGTFLLGWLIYAIGGKRKHVGQYDNYAAGHFLDRSVPYNYNYEFYSAFEHLFGGLVKRPPVKRAEAGLISLLERAGDFVRRIYTGHLNTYLAYTVVAVLLAIVIFKGGI